MITEICFNVRKKEIDSMGIVHHSCYPLWFETGRNNFFSIAGVPHPILNFKGYYLPLMEMRCNYKSPAKYGDEILINTIATYMNCVKVKFEYRIINKKSGKLLVTGKTIHAWTNKDLEPLNISNAAPEIYDRIHKVLELPDHFK